MADPTPSPHHPVTPKPRVMHVVNRVSDRGDGIANVCVDVACEQARRGQAVALASGPGGFVDLCIAEGVEYYPIEMGWRSPSDLRGSVRTLRIAIGAFHPDVLHCHTMRAVIVARLARGGGGPRIVATVHNEYQRGAILMGLADRVIGVSLAVSDAMRRRRIPRARIDTVVNGIVGSARRAASAGTETRTLSQPALLAVGAVSERKGADVLVDAFAKLAVEFPDLSLYFVGNVDWDEVPRRAIATGLGNRIHFLGFSPDPHALLEQATVFALASRRDPFPLVLLEALDVGLPIVATDVDGIPEALDGGAAGVIVPSGSAGGFADAVREFLRSDDRRSAFARAASQRSTQYSVAKMTDAYAGVYSAALGAQV